MDRQSHQGALGPDECEPPALDSIETVIGSHLLGSPAQACISGSIILLLKLFLPSANFSPQVHLVIHETTYLSTRLGSWGTLLIQIREDC